MRKIKGVASINYFDNSHRSEDLKGAAIRGGATAVAARGLTTVIQIGGTVVLARVLTPNDFGLVAMVSAFTAIFYLFQDVGLTDATVQASKINHNQVSTLFWINLAICISITLLLITLSPAIAWFYKNQQLKKIMMMSSVNFIFWGLTFQHMALLKRTMNFFRVSMIGVLSSLTSTGAAVILALTGFGYWAIVLRDTILSIIACILTWVFCRWRPGLPKKRSGARPMLKFGANSAGFYIVNYFARNLDKIFVGKKFGSAQLGFYSRAYYLATTPTGQISDSLFSVSVSTLSKIREDADKFRRYYLNLMSVISFVGMPLSIFMVVMSKELVFILLGPQWNNAAKMFSILGLAAGMNVLYYTSSSLHVSLGRSDRLLKWGIFSSAILAAAFAVGMFFGPKGVAWGYAITIILLTFPGILYAGRPIGLSFNQVFSKVWRNSLAAILAGLLLYYIKSLSIFEMPLFLTIVISLFSYFGFYLLIIIVLYGGTTPLKEMFLISRIVLSKKI
jgi:PST family polysaccharide transporter